MRTSVSAKRSGWLIFTVVAGIAWPGQMTGAPNTAEELLRPWGKAEEFSLLYRESVETLFTAREAYDRRDYRAAGTILKKFWGAHPAGSAEWLKAIPEAHTLALSKGLNFGSPGCYYALRMLTEAAAWRLDHPDESEGQAVQMTILLIGHS